MTSSHLLPLMLFLLAFSAGVAFLSGTPVNYLHQTFQPIHTIPSLNAPRPHHQVPKINRPPGPITNVVKMIGETRPFANFISKQSSRLQSLFRKAKPKNSKRRPVNNAKPQLQLQPQPQFQPQHQPQPQPGYKPIHYADIYNGQHDLSAAQSNHNFELFQSASELHPKLSTVISSAVPSLFYHPKNDYANPIFQQLPIRVKTRFNNQAAPVSFTSNNPSNVVYGQVNAAMPVPDYDVNQEKQTMELQGQATNPIKPNQYHQHQQDAHVMIQFDQEATVNASTAAFNPISTTEISASSTTPVSIVHISTATPASTPTTAISRTTTTRQPTKADPIEHVPVFGERLPKGFVAKATGTKNTSNGKDFNAVPPSRQAKQFVSSDELQAIEQQLQESSHQYRLHLPSEHRPMKTITITPEATQEAPAQSLTVTVGTVMNADPEIEETHEWPHASTKAPFIPQSGILIDQKVGLLNESRTFDLMPLQSKNRENKLIKQMDWDAIADAWQKVKTRWASNSPLVIENFPNSTTPSFRLFQAINTSVTSQPSTISTTTQSPRPFTTTMPITKWPRPNFTSLSTRKPRPYIPRTTAVPTETFRFDPIKAANTMRRLAFRLNISTSTVTPMEKVKLEEEKLDEVKQDDVKQDDVKQDEVFDSVASNQHSVSGIKQDPDIKKDQETEVVQDEPQSNEHDKQSQEKPSCLGHLDGYYADVGNECKSYFYCNKRFGNLEKFDCPAGTRFSQDSKVCMWPSTVICNDNADFEQV